MSNEDEKTKKANARGLIVVAVFMFFCAWWLNLVFTDIEDSGGSIRIHVFIAFLYKTVGKWGVVGLFGSLGGISLYIGIRDLLKP